LRQKKQKPKPITTIGKVTSMREVKRQTFVYPLLPGPEKLRVILAVFEERAKKIKNKRIMDISVPTKRRITKPKRTEIM
jgi:hypothetical protein